MNNQVSVEIPVLRGMGQGDPSSPKLSSATVQRVFKNAQLEVKKLADLRFDDDVALTTEDVKDVEHESNTMTEESLKIGLKTHKGKTKFITNTDTTDNIQINGTGIEKVTNYKYL